MYRRYCYLLSGLRGFSGDRRGVVVMLVALAAPVLLGLTAFAVDVSQWSGRKNAIQAAADNAVLSAVMAAAQAGASSTQIQNQAYAVAAATGFTNGQGGVTVTVNNPPTSGSHTTDTSAYEVIITQPQTRYYAALLGAAPTISGRAVALVAGTPACLLALDPKASGAISMTGGNDVTATNCTVAANSSSGSAVVGSGGATLSADTLKIVGNYSTSGGFTVAPPTKIKTGAPATADPYASLAVPPFSTAPCSPAVSVSGGGSQFIYAGCYKGISVSGGGTLTMCAAASGPPSGPCPATASPGNYVINGTGGVDVSLSGGSTVNMNVGGTAPGIYTLNDGSFNLSGGNTVTGSNVGIILTSTPASSTGTISISGGADLTLTPPTSGPMQGVAFYVDRNAPTSHAASSFSGGSSMHITGSIYLPSQNVSFSGGSSAGGGCLQLIANTISFTGGSGFGTSCGSLVVPGLQPPPGTTGRPVE